MAKRCFRAKNLVRKGSTKCWLQWRTEYVPVWQEQYRRTNEDALSTWRRNFRRNEARGILGEQKVFHNLPIHYSVSKAASTKRSFWWSPGRRNHRSKIDGWIRQKRTEDKWKLIEGKTYRKFVLNIINKTKKLPCRSNWWAVFQLASIGKLFVKRSPFCHDWISPQQFLL